MISPSFLRYHMEGLSKFITILHGGGSSRFITILQWGGVSRDPEFVLRNTSTAPKYIHILIFLSRPPLQRCNYLHHRCSISRNLWGIHPLHKLHSTVLLRSTQIHTAILYVQHNSLFALKLFSSSSVNSVNTGSNISSVNSESNVNSANSLQRCATPPISDGILFK